MTKTMVWILVDAMDETFDGKVRPIIGFWNDVEVDFSIDIDATTVSCRLVQAFLDEVAEVREFCEFFNDKEIEMEEVDEAIADREKFVNKVADMIKNKEYEKAFETLNF